ncbi:MAG: phosphatase PAP2 family protein [Chloroflexi bacterium]|nr:phosphatase PAP2 family protein [Chloroflexota bacterium]
MQFFIERGIDFIVVLQAVVGDWFIFPMRFFSYLGNEEFFLLVLPLIYWSVDSALGLRVGFILVTSNLFNYAGKLIFTGPRPYWVSSQVRALWLTETSFGIPSGHAQLAMSVWGMIAAYLKRAWVWVAMLTVIFFIGFSRMYLGVHFPHDVIFGWLLGAAVLWAFVWFWEPVGAWIGGKTLSQKILIAFAASLLFIALGYGTWVLRSGFQIPEEWISNALLAGAVEPEPLDPDSAFTSAGTFFGLAVGAAWIMSLGGYQASGPVGKRAIRYVIGLIGVVVFYLGLGAIFPRELDLISYLLRYVRYALIGWWVAGGAPWVFVRFKLAEQAKSI